MEEDQSNLTKFTQQDAVFAALTEVFYPKNILLLNQPIKSLLTETQRQSAILILFKYFRSKRIIDVSLEIKDEKKLKGYCSGLLDNHLRKDSRLNGENQ